jgi:hypothetical protein
MVSSNAAGVEPSSWVPSTPSAVQLVACVAAVPTAQVLQMCTYGVSPVTIVDIYDQGYTISLYAARTGKLLTSRTVDGTDQPACQSSVLVENGSGPGPSYSSLTVSSIKSVIGSYAGS